MKNILITLLLAVTFGTNTHSQNFWQQVNTNFATYRFGMTDNGHIFAHTGSNFLSKSTMNGSSGSWTQVTGFPSVSYYYLLAEGSQVFMSNGSINYDGRGIFASTDDGATWQQRNTGLGADTNMASMHVLANNYLLATTNVDPSTYHIYRSTDGGNSWTFIQAIGDPINSLEVVSPTELYFPSGTKVYKSTNNGQSWTDLNSTNPSGAIYSILHLSAGNLIATCNDEIMKSTDGGITWNFMAPTGLPSASVARRALIKSPGDTLYMATDTAKGIYWSADQGQTWDTTGSGLANSTQTFRGSLMISKGGYLFASPVNSGIYRSINPVTASQIIGNDPPVSNLTLLAYPNPSKGTVNIEVNQNESATINIFDIARKQTTCVIQKTSKGWSISGLNSGLYFYQINSEIANISSTGKLIVE